MARALHLSRSTVLRCIKALEERGLIVTEHTDIVTKHGIKRNGNLRYTLRPIHEAVEIFHARQLSAVERAAGRQRVQRKLSAMDLLPGARRKEERNEAFHLHKLR